MPCATPVIPQSKHDDVLSCSPKETLEASTGVEMVQRVDSGIRREVLRDDAAREHESRGFVWEAYSRNPQRKLWTAQVPFESVWRPCLKRGGIASGDCFTNAAFWCVGSLLERAEPHFAYQSGNCGSPSFPGCPSPRIRGCLAGHCLARRSSRVQPWTGFPDRELGILPASRGFQNGMASLARDCSQQSSSRSLPLSQFREETVEVESLFLRERVQRWINE